MLENETNELNKILKNLMNNLIKAKFLFKEKMNLLVTKYEPLSVTQHGIVPRLSNVALSKVDDNRKKFAKTI